MKLTIAKRQQVKLRLGMSGASGFGKTYSALLLAYGMTKDWSKIAVIDTENNSASLYANLGQYNVLSLSAPFSPERYSEAIRMCEDAGMDVIIIDSITHEWEGKGGCLEIAEQLGGRYQDWAKVTPRHQAFVQSVLQSKCHVITTVRRKQDYDMVKGDNGRISVAKVGTKEITREGFEYELTINFEFVNDRHLVKASKDRTGLFMGKPEFLITSDIGSTILNWCNDGVDVASELMDAVAEVNGCVDLICLREIWSKYDQFHTNKDWITIVNRRKEELTKLKESQEDSSTN